MNPIYIATEDELSEVVLRRILRDFPEIIVGHSLRRGGFGYLKRNIRAFNQSAQGIPFLLLTDLDRCPCASALITDWLRNVPRHNHIFYSV